jgi:hypothetical protein
MAARRRWRLVRIRWPDSTPALRLPARDGNSFWDD